jgi:hypothetical protein
MQKNEIPPDMATSFKDIFLLMVAFSLVFGGFVGFIATVEHRTHCTLAEQTETLNNPSGAGVLHYSDLDPETQKVFERLVAHPEKTVTADACQEVIVRNNETYYRITDWTTIIWTNPPTLASIAVSLSGVGLMGWRIRTQIR